MKRSVVLEGADGKPISVTVETITDKKPRKKFRTQKKNEFVMTNVADWEKLILSLSTAEKALLYTLQGFCFWNDCCIKDLQGNALDQKQIAYYAGLSINTLREALDGLCRKNIIVIQKAGKKKRVYLNPWLHQKGSPIDPVTMRLFTQQYNELLEQGGKPLNKFWILE